MKVKDLISELSQYDPEMEINMAVSVLPPCNCGEYCYCSYEDKEFDIEGVSKKTVYCKKTKKQNVSALTIRGV